MGIKANYLINEKTVLFKGIYYQNGELYSEVVEGDIRFLVARSPLQIIKYSLLCYGSDYNGALNSSRHHLGNKKKMYPIKVHETLDIWLFPTRSHRQSNYICFVLSYIQSSKNEGNKKTKVFLSFDHTIDLKMREVAFITKRSLADELREKIDASTKNSSSIFAEAKKGFHLVEDNGRDWKYKKKNK